MLHDTAALMGNLVQESTRMALFIYSGHGSGQMWETLLCPVDITPSKGRVPARLFQEGVRKATPYFGQLPILGLKL